MVRRILIVGEAPGRFGTGITRRRVSELAGQPWEEWADWINLLDDYPGPGASKGSGWNARAAAARAQTLLEEVAGYDAVVLLGRRVAQTMIPAGAGFPLFRWVERAGTRMAVMPHTSGIVRFWNDPANVATASAFLRALSPNPKEAPVANTESKDEAATPPDAQEPDLQRQLIDRVRETVGDGVTEIEKKGYVRLALDDQTVGYIHRPTRSGVRVEIPADGGGYDLLKVEKKGDIRKAVTAVSKRAEKAKAAAPAA